MVGRPCEFADNIMCLPELRRPVVCRLLLSVSDLLCFHCCAKIDRFIKLCANHFERSLAGDQLSPVRTCHQCASPISTRAPHVAGARMCIPCMPALVPCHLQLRSPTCVCSTSPVMAVPVAQLQLETMLLVRRCWCTHASCVQDSVVKALTERIGGA